MKGGRVASMAIIASFRADRLRGQWLFARGFLEIQDCVESGVEATTIRHHLHPIIEARGEGGRTFSSYRTIVSERVAGHRKEWSPWRLHLSPETGCLHFHPLSEIPLGGEAAIILSRD